MNKENNIKEAIKELKSLSPSEEVIEIIVNEYLKEKARADKLEKDYSKLLTKIDELEEEDN